MFIRRILSLLVICGFAGAGCDGSAGDRRISPAGGRLQVDEVAAVDVPGGAFEQKTRVAIQRVESTHAREAFGDTAVLFDVRQPLPYAFHVTTEGGPPKEPVTVEIVLPNAWRRSARVDPAFEESVLRVFGRNVWEAEGKRLVTLEPLSAGMNPHAESVRVEVPPRFFSRAASTAEGYVAVLRLGLTPAPGAEESVTIALPSPAAASAPPAAPEAEADLCHVRLGPPLRGNYRQTTPFGTQEVDGHARYHPGVDLAPDPSMGDAGHDVLAMTNGVVAAADVQSGADGQSAGWGRYVILGHGRRGGAPFTLYANLQPGADPMRIGQRVRRGDVIGRLGGAGESAGDDLHLEFVPGGAPAAVAKADARACLAEVVIDRLTAGFRSSAIVDAPAIDTDAQTVEARGSEADNDRWLFSTHAAAQQAGTGARYVSDVTGSVATHVSDRSMRIEMTSDGTATARSAGKDGSHPEGAAASGTGGVRARFHVTSPARYRLTIRYEASEHGQWRVDTRLDRTGSGTTRTVNDELKNAAGSGAGPATFDQTFEGSLEEDATYAFDFLPMLVYGGDAGKAQMSATAVLEVSAEETPRE